MLESIGTMFAATNRIAEGGMNGRLWDVYVGVDIERSFGQDREYVSDTKRTCMIDGYGLIVV